MKNSGNFSMGLSLEEANCQQTAIFGLVLHRYNRTITILAKSKTKHFQYFILKFYFLFYSIFYFLILQTTRPIAGDAHLTSMNNWFVTGTLATN